MAAPESAPSSRRSLRAAGWLCEAPGEYRKRIPPDIEPFSWFRPRTLWHSRNHLLARIHDPTNDVRRAWVAERRADGTPESLVVDRTDLNDFAFHILGDTGEGDASQYAVVPPLLASADGTAFLLIASDVVYPAGDAADYEEKFYRPYADYPGPIYAVPGNHDWYDGLAGFMLHFCEAYIPPDIRALPAFLRPLWRSPKLLARPDFERMRALRTWKVESPRQPGPYFAIDTAHLLVIGIDVSRSSRRSRSFS
jgi:hypothetical protein